MHPFLQRLSVATTALAVAALAWLAFLSDSARPLRVWEMELPGIICDQALELGENGRQLTTFSAKPEPARFALHHLVIDDETRSLFRTDRLSPADWAVLLDRLRATGATQIVITAPLSWEEPDQLALRALKMSLANFRISVTGLDAALLPTTRPRLQNLTPLRVKNDSGTPLDLARVNNSPIPPSVTETILGLREFPHPQHQNRPLFACWLGRIEADDTTAPEEIVPSLELTYLRQLSGSEEQTPATFDGKTVRFSDFVIPIDPSGHPEIPAVLEAAPPISASKILLDRPTLEGLLLVSHQNDPAELHRLAATLPILATSRRRNLKGYPLLTFQNHPTLAFSLLGAVFLAAMLATRWLPLTILALTFLTLPLAIFQIFHLWFPLTPALLSLLTAYFFYILIRRTAKPHS